MLRSRVITATVLVSLLVVSLYALTNLQVALILGLFAILGAWEWTALCGAKSASLRLAFVLTLGLAGVLLYAQSTVLIPVLVISVGWWLWAVVKLGSKSVPAKSWVCLLRGLLFLLPCWYAMVYLHNSGPMGSTLLLLLFVIVWIADTAAYFAGKAWGRVKLAPNISPGKTVEGFLAGVAAVVLFSLVSGILVWGYHGWRLLSWVVICTIAGLLSVVGDLVESKLKRTAGVKDSGVILPGHGGVLDRADSISAAAPAFALGWVAMQQTT
ncbi:MAG: phosphatidate cytidylyltransferase [Gammaproteobacteria bacterium]|nr:phosphatidate cytidylyltransferase [Gammaproteobacteria bacterium]